MAALLAALSGPDAAATRHRLSITHHTSAYSRYRHSASTVTLNVDRAPIRSVLQILFRRSGHNFVLGPGVSGTVTASLHNMLFATALQQVVSANSVPLTDTVQNGIYVIALRPPAPRPVASRSEPAAPAPVPAPVYSAPVPPAYVLPGTSGAVRVVP